MKVKKSENFNPNYSIVVAKVSKLEEHPNADRLRIATVRGYPCIVGLDVELGTVGFLVREGTQLSTEFCLANGLLRKHPETGEKLSGYLDPNGRVRSLKLRGAESEALFIPAVDLPLAALADRLGASVVDTFEAPEGEFDAVEINGKEFIIAQKFMLSQQAQSRIQGPGKKRYQIPLFPKHYDTAQLRMNTHKVSGALARLGVVYVTEKLHGTSGRTGYVPTPQQLNFWKKAWNFVVPKRCSYPTEKVEIVSGTRNCVLNKEAEGEKAKDYRHEIHNFFASFIEEGETWYYEIVGFEGTGGKAIMQPHNTSKLKEALGSKQAKEEIKRLGERVVYSYGCDQNGPGLNEDFDSLKDPCYKIFVYRITKLEDKEAREFNFIEVENRVWRVLDKYPECLNVLDVVPVVDVWVKDMTEEQVLERASKLSRQPSRFGGLSEGVVLRIEEPREQEEGVFKVKVHPALKHKSFLFCTLEGIMANDPDFVDAEELA